MEHASQQTKEYSVTKEEVGNLVNALVNGLEWEGPVPEHLMGISISPHPEVEKRNSGLIMVQAIYLALE